MRKNKKGNATISDLKKGVEKKEKSALVKEEKELKPGTKSLLVTIRTIFWIAFVIVVIVGTLQVVRSKQPRIIENTYKYEFNQSESDKAKAFAESFVRDYLTYGTEEDNFYMEKMNRYINGSITLGRPENANGTSTVTDSMVWEVEMLDATHSNIIVKADLDIVNNNKTEERYNPETGQREQMPIESQKTYFVSVPILAKDGQVIVNDYPVFVAAEEKLNANMESYVGEVNIMDDEKKVVEGTLEDFFDVYYGGTEGQIKSFFEADQKIKGLNGEFEFKEIVSLEAYKKSDKVKAVVTVGITQTDLGSEFNQRFLIELKKTEDRWVIVSMENRGSKIESKEE